MGLPGSGKTTLAQELKKKLNATWINADKVRKKYNNWNFSKNGVIKQARRMEKISKISKKKITIVDFVCPYEKGRKIFKPDYLIWMDTIKKGRFSTFDKSFEKPRKFNFKVKKKKAKFYSKKIINDLKKVYG
jgi:adenylylsulfate kinase